MTRAMIPGRANTTGSFQSDSAFAYESMFWK